MCDVELICSFLLYKYKTRNTINSSSWVMAYGSGGCIACCFFKSISRRELNVLLYNPMVLVITFVITLSRCMARVKNTRAQWNSLFSESMQLKRRHYLTLLFRGKNLATRANLNPDLNRNCTKLYSFLVRGSVCVLQLGCSTGDVSCCTFVWWTAK